MQRTLSVAGVLLAGALVACGGCSRGRGAGLETPEDEVWVEVRPGEPGPRVVVAEARDLPRRIAAAGRIAFDDLHVSHVLSPVTGRVTRVLANPGDRVRKGTALATILSPDLGAASSDAVKARADFAAAGEEERRQRSLAAVGAGSQRDLEAAEDALRKAAAERERSEERSKLLQGGATGGGVTQEYTLRSPIEGEVISRAVNPGLEVQGQYSGGQSAELFTVGDVRRVWLLADVPAADLEHVALGAEVSARVVAHPGRVFRGPVEWISTTLDPVLRTARIRAALSNEDEALGPEMYAQASIAAPPRRALAIPRTAVAAIAGQSFAWVADGAAPDGRRRFRRRLVRVADAGDDWLEALAGIAAGEQVLVEAARHGEARPGEALLSPEQVRRAGIRVEPATEQDLPDVVSLGGRVTFDDLRATHVFSPVTGRVTRVWAAPGARVKKGDPLAAIDSPDVGAALADVRKAEADLTQAEHEYRRQEELVAERAGARRDLEAAESAWRKAQAEAVRARQKTALLRAGGAGDPVSQQYVLRSPIDGEVVARNVNPGTEVQGQYSGGGSPVELFTIGDGSRLWVLADAYEVDLPRIRAGVPVELRVPALPGRPFRGTVEWVSKVVDPQLRTAKVRCSVEDRGHALRPEMYEGITLRIQGERIVAVPRTAVLRVGGERVVFVRKGAAADGRLAFEPRTVVADEDRDTGLVPVWSGLSSGEAVVTEGAFFVLGALQEPR